MNKPRRDHRRQSRPRRLRLRQANAPTNHSAREIVQMSTLAEYLHEMQTPDVGNRKTAAQHVAVFEPADATVAA